ncbi:hypothetical protein NEF87_004781 [Candidatus Lokiarchaeum ossiferum]|uniref:Tetrapyrrole biosynthesis glutamyl-tRNA reductase dimerisation domain-containing protein n=1 Tax=Candidatus Lokiarchaeum ossiferum TaxID=2951803 RepID=A0ABY6I101_9ARCH|nr:hypothetical protein NEF87_004781 [Candidatus Lokiarchaeum sp. B-35]
MTEQDCLELESQISKTIKKNRAELREKVSQLSKGILEEDDFLIYLINEFTRMHKEISSYTRIHVKRLKHLNSKELIEDNIIKAAIIETLFELLPGKTNTQDISRNLLKSEQRSELLYSASTQN